MEDVARLKRLVEASYSLHTTLDLEELLGVIVKTAAEGVDAERGTVFLLTEHGELWSKVLSGDAKLEIRLPPGKGIAGAVARTGEPVRVDDAYADPRFDRSWDERSGYRTRRILCAPIRSREGRVVGVFQLLNKRSGPFTADDEAFLAALSVHAALAVENARLHAAALEKERQEREIGLARAVQRQLQPECAEARAGSVLVAGMNEICEDATGDYYDFLLQLPGGRVGVAIGDVSGHGLQAALVMAEARAFLRAFTTTATSLPRALDLVNDFLVPDMRGGRFLSLFAAVVDPVGGAMEWCNAGHNPPLHFRAATGEVETLEATGRVAGILPGAAYRAGAPRTLAPGDALLLYTDGVTEARNAAGEFFGEERLRRALARGAGAEPAALLRAIRDAVAEFAGPGRNRDDVTMVAVTRAG
jgi:sigma-B regulation protein RsbU (phosphoserine phosphatase)